MKSTGINIKSIPLKSKLPKNSSRPKHALLAEMMDREIRQLEPGSAIMPVTELMARFKVSQGTVVHALRHLRTKGLIIKPPGKKRLVAAGQKIQGDAVLNILFIRPRWNSPDYDTMNHALFEEANRQRVHLEPYSSFPGASEDLAAVVQSHDGVIILPSSTENASLTSVLASGFTPAVMLWEEQTAGNLICVADDDLEAGRMAARHLLGLGHKKIAAVLSEPPVASMGKRLAGWAEVMRAEGCADPDKWVIDCSVKPGKDSIIGSYEKLRRWLFQNNSSPKFTAVFCLCWTGALAMLRALREVGIEVPRDMSVICHGGENCLCEFSNPPLTVVQGDAYEMAQKAFNLLKAACIGEAPSRRAHFIKPTLIVRGSTRKPGRR